MRALLLVAAAGCWTGSETPVADTTVATQVPATSARHRAFKLTLERRPCMGACPTYRLTIHGDGRVAWYGKRNVAALGARQGKVTPAELNEIVRRIEQVRFFERDENGHLPVKSECTTVNGTTTCTMGGSFSFCTDTSHTIITVMRKRRTHRIDNANCSDDDELADLATLVEDAADIGEWVGESDE